MVSIVARIVKRVDAAVLLDEMPVPSSIGPASRDGGYGAVNSQARFGQCRNRRALFCPGLGRGWAARPDIAVSRLRGSGACSGRELLSRAIRPRAERSHEYVERACRAQIRDRHRLSGLSDRLCTRPGGGTRDESRDAGFRAAHCERRVHAVGVACSRQRGPYAHSAACHAIPAAHGRNDRDRDRKACRGKTRSASTRSGRTPRGRARSGRIRSGRRSAAAFSTSRPQPAPVCS